MAASPYSCATCGFDLWIPVVSLSVSEVGFYDDGRFPGRCLVVLRDHEEHLTDLPTTLLHGFMSDVQRVGGGVRSVTGSQRVNFAVLGNTEPHLHCHVIPRGAPGDVNITRTPWEHPAPKHSIGPERRATLLAELRHELRDG